jgi:hypothetical protein
VLSAKAVQVAVLTLALSACGGQRSGDGTDGAAVAACRGALEKVGASDGLATTVREEGGGFLVRAWRSGRAEGNPDYLCQVARDDTAERGVSVVKLQTRDSSGDGYRSTLDIEFDDDA